MPYVRLAPNGQPYQESPVAQAGVCMCVECHTGPLAERPRRVQAGLCAGCIDEFFEPWDQVLAELTR